jgi:enterochelin esterase-like enzyme
VFSGSFWWRSQALDKGYVEATDRIMHAIVREGEFRPHQAFWFQAGTDDENADRNSNGIIDAIEDTLGLIDELEKKGYRQGHNITYYQVEGGTHDPETWGRAMPVFLMWLVGNKL